MDALFPRYRLRAKDHGSTAQPTVVEILEHVSDEIHELWLDQYVWQTLSRISQQSDAARGSFNVAWIGEQYYRRAALAVRAMVDRRSDTDSLINVLLRVMADSVL